MDIVSKRWKIARTTDAQHTNAVRASHPNRIVLAEVLLSLFHARGMG